MKHPGMAALESHFLFDERKEGGVKSPPSSHNRVKE